MSQDFGHYNYAARRNGIILNKNEPLSVQTLTVAGIANGTPAVLTPAASIAFTPSTAVTQVTPAQAETITFGAAGPAGTEIYLEVITSGTTSYTLTFAGAVKSQGTLATGTTSGATFLISYVSDGTNWLEASRTSAM